MTVFVVEFHQENVCNSTLYVTNKNENVKGQ